MITDAKDKKEKRVGLKSIDELFKETKQYILAHTHGGRFVGDYRYLNICNKYSLLLNGVDIEALRDADHRLF